MRNLTMEAHQSIDVAELLSWQDHCAERARGFWQAVEYARYRMRHRLSAHDQNQVIELVELLEEVQKPLRPPILYLVKLRPSDPPERLFDYQKHCILVGTWAIAALAVYDDDKEALKNFARLALGRGERWPHLSIALVENHLRGWKDWRDVRDPQAWIARVAHRIESQEVKKDAAATDTVPLETIEGTRSESADYGLAVERCYAFDALRNEARRRGDIEVEAYIEGLRMAKGLHHRGAHRQIRKQMGWNKFKARDIQRRFFRLRDAAADYVTRGAISEASRTTYFETLRDGEKGREFGTWAHKKPPIKP